MAIKNRTHQLLAALTTVSVVLLGCRQRVPSTIQPTSPGVTTVRFVLGDAEPTLTAPRFVGFDEFIFSIPDDAPATQASVKNFASGCREGALRLGTPRRVGTHSWVFYVVPCGGQVVVEIPDHEGSYRPLNVSNATGFNVMIRENNSNVEVVSLTESQVSVSPPRR